MKSCSVVGWALALATLMPPQRLEPFETRPKTKVATRRSQRSRLPTGFVTLPVEPLHFQLLRLSGQSLADAQTSCSGDWVLPAAYYSGNRPIGLTLYQGKIVDYLPIPSEKADSRVLVLIERLAANPRFGYISPAVFRRRIGFGYTTKQKLWRALHLDPRFWDGLMLDLDNCTDRAIGRNRAGLVCCQHQVIPFLTRSRRLTLNRLRVEAARLSDGHQPHLLMCDGGSTISQAAHRYPPFALRIVPASTGYMFRDPF